uniref:Uncharacterized protein n=1 Tax=Arundo donax TaxID=35708 RepID=A0A0A9H274_ARUDO
MHILIVLRIEQPTQHLFQPKGVGSNQAIT